MFIKDNSMTWLSKGLGIKIGEKTFISSNTYFKANHRGMFSFFSKENHLNI